MIYEQRLSKLIRKRKVRFVNLLHGFSVSFSFVWRLVKRFRKMGSVAPKSHGGGVKPKLDLVDLFTLRDLSNEHPDATLAELSELFFQQTGIKVNGSTVARKLRRLRISRKKKTFHASEQETPEVQKERQEFQSDKPNMPVDKLIFIDESGINTGMVRT